jgi:Na+-driven multidrug efflux pump
MKDLTHGSIVSHILTLAPPIVAGMVTIMICQLVDLYFVAGLGDAAIAGVAAAGNAGFLINALMQVLGVGTVALISHAWGAGIGPTPIWCSTSRSACPRCAGC